MDATQIAALLVSTGPYGLAGLFAIVAKRLYDDNVKLRDKLEDTLNEWRKDSAAQGDKLASILEEAAKEPRRRG